MGKQTQENSHFGKVFCIFYKLYNKSLENKRNIHFSEDLSSNNQSGTTDKIVPAIPDTVISAQNKSIIF